MGGVYEDYREFMKKQGKIVNLTVKKSDVGVTGGEVRPVEVGGGRM